MFGLGQLGRLGLSGSGKSLAAQIMAMAPKLWLEPSVDGGYQDSAGTTPLYAPGGGSVDPPVGLALDKSQGLVLGPDIKVLPATVSGGFTSDALGVYRNGSTGQASFANGVAGRTYLVEFTVSGLTGDTFFVRAQGGTANNITSNGAYSLRLLSVSLGSIIFAPWGGVAGTATITNISVRELTGNHASQATSTARPVLSARKNLLLATDMLATQNVTTVAGQYTIQFSGAGSVTASGTYAGVLTSGQTFTATAGTLTLTVAGSVTSAQLEAGPTATGYQSVTNANTYDASAAPLYWKLDKVDDRLLVTVPPGGWTGTMIHSTVAGTISYAATLPAGSFAIGTNGVDDYSTPDNRLVGQIFVNSALSDSDAGKVKDYFVSRGGGPKDAGAYAGVTDFSAAWYLCSSMSGPFPLIDTSNGTNFHAAWAACSSMSGPFPLIDTSNGTDFGFAWFMCSSMSGPFPLIDTSNGTDFYAAWAVCSSLTSFPAGMFDTCPATSFTDAFVDCALNQTSIDNILVSIAAAGTSGGTLNMTGGTNATPSATGLAAKATLVGRGWTVTHN